MRVLLLGATGTIGSAILTELLQHGHSVLALARTETAEQKIVSAGAVAIRGDLHEPHLWANSIENVDAVIHAAATFCEEMGSIDLRVIKELIKQGQAKNSKTRFIYTGGVWLYGETGNDIATEESTLNPISSFHWMVPNSLLVLNASCFHTNIIHPGVVYAKDAGALSTFIPNNGQIEVWGFLEVRWPVVHAHDLATAYRLVLENGVEGQSYNVCSESGVRVGDIADRYITRSQSQPKVVVRSAREVIAENGAWALGPTLDQRMSADKIKNALNWAPIHNDILSELA
ncbi:NAD-dependent epimerase/dehydratase family protein [uncultured Vibrio sp.]|uniref:NAD-dependent epimerase/dehydratase family protein n=1 Tax=uncultured Vibrio sp. TaxID=114054 RepID=UPI0025CFA9D3|nr:NAD-dependent epimerase/dehydratase family protein [uncultured Vibrio sp.]